MTVKIENDFLSATFSEQGAELISLKSKVNTIEYIWQGDPAYWARHSPILFPIVGRLQENRYFYQGKSYEMSQHGFARDCLFEVVELGEELVSFSLSSNKETKKYYPFDFQLVLSYKLEENNLNISYQVENTGQEKMYFSIGGHPAFNVPLEKSASFEDYHLSFYPEKNRIQIPLSGPFADFEQKKISNQNSVIKLERRIFEEDALIFETVGKTLIELHSDHSPNKICLSYENIPYVGIWSPYGKAAPFVCIEPWWGIADSVDSTGNLVEKTGINQLEAKKIFMTSYTLTVF